jgi:RNA polymerase sigma factor (sigma-70 family)
MPDPGSDTPRWPVRLAALLTELRAATEAEHRDALRGETWLLLHAALSRYAANGIPRLSVEDREDVAAEKSLDLLARAESGAWRVDGRSPGEIAAFLATVARHGVVDWSRRQARWVRPRSGAAMEDLESIPHRTLTPASPEVRVEGREFARALRDCAEALQPRARRAWFFRVFYDMPTREIAAHPNIALQPGHVDVLLQRSRQAVRDCMQSRGHATQDIPPGTFAELWKRFEVTVRTAEVDP